MTLYCYIHSGFTSVGNMYIADSDNHRIRKVTMLTGIITTIAGSGSGGYSGDGGVATSATLNNPQGVAVDASGRAYFSHLLLLCSFIYALQTTCSSLNMVLIVSAR